jgi:hypothetical protein
MHSCHPPPPQAIFFSPPREPVKSIGAQGAAHVCLVGLVTCNQKVQERKTIKVANALNIGLPLLDLRPRALSNFLPLDRTYGFLCCSASTITISRRTHQESKSWRGGITWCGPMPKCRTASRAFFLPRRRIVLEPVGAL